MIYIISTLEIALLILIPLIIFYQWNNSPKRKYIINIALLYLIWFFTYAGLHEFGHLLGSWITGTKINGYQLIPHFWEGDFKTAYVDSVFENRFQSFVSVIMPYLRDIVFLLMGLIILKRKRINSLFLIGLTLLLFILSPLFDIINNYSGYLFLSFGDFNELSKSIGVLYANICGMFLTLAALALSIRVYITCKNCISRGLS